MIRTVRFSLLICLVLAAVPASAKVADEPNLVAMVRQVAAIAPPLSGAHRYAIGDAMLKTDILWEQAGALGASRSVTFGDKTVEFASGAFHPLARITLPNKTDVIPAVCTRVAAAAYRSMEKGVKSILFGGQLFKDLAKAAQDRQTCLVDTDGDQLLDTAVLVNGGAHGADAVKPIAPVSMRAEQLVPVSPDDYIRLTYSNLVGKSSVYFEFEVVSQGQKRKFQTFDFMVDGKSEQMERETGIWAKKSLPFPVRLLGLDYHISQIDVPAKAVELDWGSQARAPFLIGVPEETQLIYRPY